MKKGISLVALVITIIVLIVLTAAVVLTGGDSPEQAQKAVFFNDVATIQEAVALKMTNNIAKLYDNGADLSAGDVTINVNKLEGIIGDQITAGDVTTASFATGKTFYKFAANAGTTLNLGGAELTKYCVDQDGTVYSIAGRTFGGVTYYNRTTSVSASSSQG